MFLTIGPTCRIPSYVHDDTIDHQTFGQAGIRSVGDEKSVGWDSCNLAVITKAIEKTPVISATSEDSMETNMLLNSSQVATGAVQLPPFSGADPIGWLAWANQRFEIHSTDTEKKVSLAVVAMEEFGLYWMTWLRSRKPELMWEEFAKALVSRFNTRLKGGPFEWLADVK